MSQDIEPQAQTEPQAQKGEVAPAESDKVAAKTFTADQVEKIVLDRLARDRKARSKQDEDEAAPVKKPSNVEDDYRQKLSQLEKQNRSLQKKVGSYRETNLKSKIENELAKAGCLEPDYVAEHFLTKKLVHMDDEDNLIVENTSNDLNDLIQSHLATRPHLVPKKAAGVGSKAPGNRIAPIGSPEAIKAMSSEEFAAFKKNTYNIDPNSGRFRV